MTAWTARGLAGERLAHGADGLLRERAFGAAARWQSQAGEVEQGLALLRFK